MAPDEVFVKVTVIVFVHVSISVDMSETVFSPLAIAGPKTDMIPSRVDPIATAVVPVNPGPDRPSGPAQQNRES